MSKQVVLDRLYRLPGEYVSAEDWNYLVQLVYYMWENLPAPLQQYFSNDSFIGLNTVTANIIKINMLTANGYQALWNNKQVNVTYIYKLLQVLAEYNTLKQIEAIYKVVPTKLPVPIQKLKELPTLSKVAQKVYLQIYGTNLLAQVLYAQLQRRMPPQYVLSQNYLITSPVPLTSLLLDTQHWREAIVKVLGPDPLIVNNSLQLQPHDCIKITVSDPSAVTFSSTKTYVSLLQTVGQLPPPKYAYAITVTNSQPDPTPLPFQQLLILNLQGIISSPSQLSNLLFSSDIQGNSPLYAWVEQYSSDLSSVYIWVNLPNGIPANSSITIYMHVMSSSQYPYTGINSMLQCSSIPCTPNASNDNGANVFIQYANFLVSNGGFTGVLFYGSFTPTWSQGYGWEMLNGTTNNSAYIWNNTALPLIPLTLELIGYINGAADGLSTGFYAPGAPNGVNATYGNTPVNGNIDLGVQSDQYFGGNAWYINNTFEGQFGTFINGNQLSIAFYLFWRVVFTGSSSSITGIGVNSWTGSSLINVPQYGTPPYSGSVSTSYGLVSGNQYWWLASESGGASETYYLHWFRIRATPPNNTMPSVSPIKKVYYS